MDCCPYVFHQSTSKPSIKKHVDSTFKPLLEKYLASIDDCEIRTLEDLIKFNNQHPEEELPACEYPATHLRRSNPTY